MAETRGERRHVIELPMSSDGSACYRISTDTAEEMVAELKHVAELVDVVCDLGGRIVMRAWGAAAAAPNPSKGGARS